jgi:hypothetical protein
MGRTGKVDSAYRKLKQKKDKDKRFAFKSSPARSDHCDHPTWDHEGLSLAGRGCPEYAVMSMRSCSLCP